MKPVSVHVSETAYVEMKALATLKGRPVAELIRQAMEEYLERERGRRESLLDRAAHPSGRLLRPWTRDELFEEMVSRS
ncbi:MAG TPA: ribbon-helix-helix protein, CopG family [Vicinamibacteria bacterium]|nr:ribbon-helix-helix protein, CopG family [Vicinamibacteria bacterium]